MEQILKINSELDIKLKKLYILSDYINDVTNKHLLNKSTIEEYVNLINELKILFNSYFALEKEYKLPINIQYRQAYKLLKV